jgi:hypothetical protein
MLATIRSRTFRLLVCRLQNVKIRIYKNIIILPLVLYGYVTWFLTLREERRLRVFEYRVLGRIFRPKRGEGRKMMKNFITCILRQL